MLGLSLTVTHAAPPLAATASASAWAGAAKTHLTWDVVDRRTAREATTVYVATSDGTIYVRFDATQREPVVATAHSNDTGAGNDDAVWVDLWPHGPTGVWYQFEVTPNGTHYESSSENSSYQPIWQSYGAIRGGGYTVTFAIPLSALHGAGAGAWRAQFVRLIHATGAEQVWSYDPSQNSPDDPARAGTLFMPGVVTNGASRAGARAAVYALAEGASRTIGGSTSRVGADFSVPITPTASFFATVHPDFSNVELDQQTIAPSVFQRFYSEVRPFFTQGSSFYNKDSLWVTNAPIVPLYTPSIPTPREGYALEGTQGPVAFAAFDAIGDQRTDAADTVSYTSPDTRLVTSAQQELVDEPNLTDRVTDAAISYNSLKNLKGYFDYGSDSGTNVLDGNDAQWYDASGAWTSKTFALYGALRKVGDYYNPVDGYIFHTGIAGWGYYAAKIFDFSPNDVFLSAGAAYQYDVYQGRTGGTNESDSGITFDFLTRSAWDLQINSGANYWRFGDVLTPVSQSGGFVLTYHSGLTTNNPSNFPFHGSSATPATITYTTGRYGTGRLDTWVRNTTLRAGSHGWITLAADNTAQRFASASANVQWFETASYTNQIGANSSVAVGLRRVAGVPPLPNGGGNCAGTCTNVSLAYHYRARHEEIYLAYGDPNTLTTVPQLLFKTIFYAGADKGT